ncbi:tripartite tricarboxylate transporter TctB family protein [Bacillus sp. 1P10SD]|uniref:tripartite tricarboxylate transporter TctB family protein n=1 Tax=Bacillus sp. 1P10SD TaxID=3132265 RepID=UPI0039A4A13B
MKIANMIFHVILIAVSLFFFKESLSFPKGDGLGGLSPAFFPQLMLILVIVFSAYDLIVSFLKKENARFFEGVTGKMAVSFGVVFGSMLLMIFLLGKLPFILIAAVMLFIQCMILKLKLGTSLVTSVVLSVSIYLIFVKGFNVLL